MKKLGTVWTAPEEGADVAELLHAFSCAEKASEYGRASRVKAWEHVRINLQPSPKANLALTGAQITDYDWLRLKSAAFKIGK